MKSYEDETTQKLRSQEPAFLTRIRLRAQRRILWLRACWSSNFSEEMQGLAISHNEVDRILADPEQFAGTKEVSFYAKNAHARQLNSNIDTIDRVFADDENWLKLRQDFALSEQEVDLLSLTVAIEVDPMLRRVYSYMQDDANASFPTPWLAASLFQWSSDMRIGPEAALVRWRMAWPLEGIAYPWSVNAPWMADPHIVSWLTQGYGQDPALAMAIHLLLPTHDKEKITLYPAQLNAMQAFVRAMFPSQDTASPASMAPAPLEIELVGPAGAGKRTLAQQFCDRQGRNMLAVDASLLFGADAPLAVQIEKATRAVRAARLSEALPYWHNIEGVDGRAWGIVLASPGLAIFGTSSPMPGKRNGVAKKSFHLPRLTRPLRIALWRQLSDAPIPFQVSDWVLTPGEIANAARVAPAGDEAVAEACQHILRQGPDELFTALPCPFTWDDIILAPTLRQHLAELEDQARLRWLIYEEWGFERLFALGQGVTALFAGPSGTGKTMAAQVLARSLGMDLYRVDLAGVMSKYIGETEKRLKLIFDTCERANVLLFFDEADALFGQRTQVKDAHDRFANIEIDYLLQRMEQFDGIAILATNRKGDMDTAFLRRLRFIIDFVHPGPTERLTLWQLSLPRQAPGGEELLDGIDWDFLATRLNMTGADIKASALGAAFLARSAGTRINMKQVLYASRREMFKQGINLRSGDWEE